MAEKLTPMMQQYLEIKEQYQDCILFFRLGDFYEMFYEDALTASREMEVTLTKKSCGLKEKAPMCGVPYHAADTYISKLIEKGYKVAICEQTDEPSQVRGIVKREVIRIVTPGTLVNQSMLKENKNNYLASVYTRGEKTGLAYCDISTGELIVSEYKSSENYDDILNELIKIDVREVILNEDLRESELADSLKSLTNSYISVLNDKYFDKEQAELSVRRQFTVNSINGLGFEEDSRAVNALGAMLSYLLETQKQSLSQLTNIKIMDNSSHMMLDKSAIRNLELTETLFEKKVSGSLLGVLDKTETAMGSRKMKKWIREPLNSVKDINLRLDAVEVLMDDIIFRNNIREALKGVYDLERLSGRIACGNANGRDMLALRNSIAALPDIKSDMSVSSDELLKSIAERISTLGDVFTKIDSAVKEDAPVTIKDGGLIKDGYSKELDEIKEASSGSMSWIMGLEENERKRTGIKNLKVGFNKVFGYYIEVTKLNAENVPEDYIRKQTLVNCERYVTPELKDMEAVVLNAESRINSLEYELFSELREYLKTFTRTIQETAEAVSELDVLASFAEAGSGSGYIKPVVNDSEKISITGGRHPVIEQSIKDGVFVANDTFINQSDQSMLLITGPNMSGKSTYMRQTALIVLMAQIGCFVPAETAEIGIVDRIYTRIGASDNLTQGQSTFYVEMSELAYILNTATNRSLVILDEIGRGTSTYDGLSIAWAVVDYLCSKKRHVRTLFASHYHELTALEGTVFGFKNLNVSVSEKSGDVVFLHKIAEGSASKSYGIHVAKIAGVPETLLKTAQQKLNQLEKNSVSEEFIMSGGNINAENVSDNIDDSISEEQMSFLTFKTHPVVDMIKSLDIMKITPAESIAIIEELKKAVEKM
ncbi:MAG: DNA mismatch repair protein MutS [Firmicutes bacterium]|nr:DNA mismatch repair protein MutS [Bacillota bacterium]